MKKLIFRILETILLDPDKTIILLKKIVDLIVTNITFRTVNVDPILKKVNNMYIIFSFFYNLSKNYYINCYLNLLNLLPNISYYLGEFDQQMMLKIQDIDDLEDHSQKINVIESINQEIDRTYLTMEKTLNEVSSINLTNPLILKSAYFRQSYHNLQEFLTYKMLQEKLSDETTASLNEKIDTFTKRYNITSSINKTCGILLSDHKHVFMELSICSKKNQVKFIETLLETTEQELFYKPDYLDCSIIKILKDIWDNPKFMEDNQSNKLRSYKDSIKILVQDNLRFFDEKDLIISGHGIDGCLALLFCLDKDIQKFFCENRINLKIKNVITYGMPPFLSEDYLKISNGLLEQNNIRLFQFTLPTDCLSFFTINDNLISCQREVIILAPSNEVEKFSKFYMKKIDQEKIPEISIISKLFKKEEKKIILQYLLELNNFEHYFQIIDKLKGEKEEFQYDKKDIYFYNDITLCNFDFD